MVCKDKRKKARRRAILGIGPGAARGRLYRKLARKLFKITHNMVCGICGEQIRDTEQFHVDHVNGWASLEEYLDLSNLQPAHVKCNTVSGGMTKHHSEETIKKRIKEYREKDSS